MASTTQVVLIDPHPDAAAHIERRLHQLEQRWSRFLPESEVSRLNRSPDEWLTVSADTIRLIEAMRLAATATGGAFDPTFLHQLLTAGYTTSIDDPSLITIGVDMPSREHTVADVEIDHRTGRVRRPVGLSLDPGGIGKGFAADLVVTEALRSGTGGALVSIGGDIAAAGRTPTPAGWIVDIEDPHRPPAVLRRFAVSDGGIATSSTRSRRWRTGGVDRHHVIDPMTGDSSRTDLATVTVVATSGWLAEAHATAALLSGAAGAIGYLAEHGLSGVVVTTDERVLTSDDLAGIAAGVRS